MKLSTPWLPVVAALMLLAAGCVAAQPDLASIVKQDAASLDKGDVAAVAAHFAEDVELVAPPYCPPEVPCHGKAQVQHVFEQMATGGTTATITDQQVTGNTVKSRVEIRGGPAKAAGIDRFVYYKTVTFAGELISKIVHEYDLSDEQTAKFLKWASAQ